MIQEETQRVIETGEENNFNDLCFGHRWKPELSWRSGHVASSSAAHPGGEAQEKEHQWLGEKIASLTASYEWRAKEIDLQEQEHEPRLREEPLQRNRWSRQPRQSNIFPRQMQKPWRRLVTCVSGNCKHGSFSVFSPEGILQAEKVHRLQSAKILSSACGCVTFWQKLLEPKNFHFKVC